MKKLLKRMFIFLMKLLLLLIIISVAWVTLYKFVNPPITPLMLIRYLEQASGQRSIKTKWKSCYEISNNMKMAVIAAEDQTFPFNNGFDFHAIEEAIDDRLEGSRLRGASTISQQSAKNVFLWPERSWVRKGFEAYFTVLIEKIWGKKRILEIYLNVIETGNGIYGVDEAAQVYFGRSAKNLDIVDASLIAAILPDPRVTSPAKPSEHLLNRERWIREQISNLGGTSYLKNIK
jgi:monofunctional biosynthetic peptidoglycan transglycosylase